MCLNRFTSTLIKNNIIHDHTGPYFVQTSLFTEQPETWLLDDQFRSNHSNPAIMFSNKTYNNDLSYVDVSEMIVSCEKCHYCNKQNAGLACEDCGKVFYCNRICMMHGYKSHEIFCKNFKANHVYRLKLVHVTMNPTPSVPNFKGTKNKKDLLNCEFLVKVQAGSEGHIVLGGGLADKIEDSEITIYDKSRTVSGIVEHEQLFNLVRQFGKLGSELNFSKRLYLHAKIVRKNKDHIQVRTDKLVHDQDW